MESWDVDGSFEQGKQQVCKHVILEKETERERIMLSYIVRNRDNIVFLVVQEKELKTPSAQ